MERFHAFIRLVRLAVLLGAAAVAIPGKGAAQTPKVFSIRDFGAVGDGKTKDTAAFQKALDTCAVSGGGEVLVPAGNYLIGSVQIGNRTILRLERNSVIAGSPDADDYPMIDIRWEGRWQPGRRALIYASNVDHIGIVGPGRIEGNAEVAAPQNPRGVVVLEPINCNNILWEGFTVTQGGNWATHPTFCTDVVIRDVTITGRRDGIDIDSCRNVLIDKCYIDTGDDSISLKSGRGMDGARLGKPTEDVVIRNCTLIGRNFACVGIGSETSAGVRNVRIENCECTARTFAVYIKSRIGRAGVTEKIVGENLDILGGGFLKLNLTSAGNTNTAADPVEGLLGIPAARELSFNNVQLANATTIVDATAIAPEKPIEGLSLTNVTGVAAKGIALSHARNVVLRGIQVTGFQGPLLTLEDVKGSGLEGAVQGGAAAASADAPTTNTAVVPALNPGFMNRHEQFVEIAKKGDIDVLFMGDSITDWWRGSGRPGTTPGPGTPYAGKPVFDQYFGSWKVANFGIAGDTTQGVLWRLQNGEGQGFQPKAIMLLIGVNNTRRNSAAEIAEGVGAVVRELRKDFPAAKILLLGIFPTSGPDSPVRAKIAEINSTISRLHDGEHVFYRDIGDRFVDAEGRIPRDVMSDSLHPTTKGYGIWAEAVRDTLAGFLGQAATPAQAPDMNAADPAKRVTLWNGRDISNWKMFLTDAKADSNAVWSAKDGVLRLDTKISGYLYTPATYSNYRLHVEWRWPKDAGANSNSGVLLHVHGPEQIWPACFECQLKAGNAGQVVGMGLDIPDAPMQNNRKRAPRLAEGSEKPFGEWNTYEIDCRDDTIEVFVNGVRQNRVEKLPVRAGGIALQMEGYPIEFQNVWLEPLSIPSA